MELFKAELLKIKHTSVFQLAVFLPMISIIMGVNFYSNMKERMTDMLSLDVVSSVSFISFVGFLLPLIIIYVAITIGRIENINNGWKQILTMPIKRENLYIAKYLVLLLIFTISIVSYLVEYTIGVYFLGIKDIIPINEIINMVYVFVASQPFICLLFVLSNRFNSVSVPIGVGMTFVLSSAIIVQSKYWIYAPWTYALVVGQQGLSLITEILPIISVSLVLFAIIFFFDIVSFKKKDII